MNLVCMKCASADCTCGRLAGIAAVVALVEAAAEAILGGADDPQTTELASLLRARRREAEKMGDAP
jgi:hypothetical protein